MRLSKRPKRRRPELSKSGSLDPHPVISGLFTPPDFSHSFMSAGEEVLSLGLNRYPANFKGKA